MKNKNILALVVIGIIFVICIVSCGSGEKAEIGRCVVCGSPTAKKKGRNFVCSSCSKSKRTDCIIFKDNKYIFEVTF